MPTARTLLAAATGPDGRIYAFGGSSGDTAEAYDPIADTWSTVAPMPTPRSLLSAATGSDGRIYVLGGSAVPVPFPDPPFNTVEAYDPLTDTWAAAAPMPTPRRGMAAVAAPDGLIWAIGGDLSLRIVEVYDPVGNVWSPVDRLRRGRRPGAAIGIDGRIYAIGGEFDLPFTVEVFVP